MCRKYLVSILNELNQISIYRFFQYKQRTNSVQILQIKRNFFGAEKNLGRIKSGENQNVIIYNSVQNKICILLNSVQKIFCTKNVYRKKKQNIQTVNKKHFLLKL